MRYVKTALALICIVPVYLFCGIAAFVVWMWTGRELFPSWRSG